jgi:hypothetical protein
VNVSGTSATPNGSKACPFTSLTAALAVAGAKGSGITLIDMEPGTYSGQETFPLTIPQGLTVQGDPAAGITDASQVTISGGASQATAVVVEGTLNTTTVTCPSGSCPGVLLRMDQGSPVISNVTIASPGKNGPVACVDVDSFPGSSFAATIGTGTLINGCEVGLRASNTGKGGGATVQLSVTGAEIRNNTTHGVTVAPAANFSVGFSNTRIHNNANDGVLISASSSVPGTFALSLGDASCDGSHTNEIFCNGWYGVEDQTALQLDIHDDAFDNDPPTFPSSYTVGVAPSQAYDINQGPPAFSEGCNSTSANACTCPAPSGALYVSASNGSVAGNGSASCPFPTVTAARTVATSDSIPLIYLEAGSYTAETFPLTIPVGVTVEADPAANLTASQVVIDGSGQGGFPHTVELEGTLEGVTVTDDTANNGGALIRMGQGSPVLIGCTLLGGPAGGSGSVATNAGITTNTDANASFTATITNCVFKSFAADGIRLTSGNAGLTVTMQVSGSTFSDCANDGINITDSAGNVDFSLSGSTLHDNGKDGVAVGAVTGTATIDLGMAGCPPGPGGSGYDNAFYCNGKFGIENNLGSTINVTYDAFTHVPPSVGVPTPSDLSNNMFTTTCTSALSPAPVCGS